MRKTIIASLFLTLLAASGAHAEKITINPGPVKGVTLVKENARGTVWCEIIPMTGTQPNVVMQIYTSTGVDNCTEERSAALDMTKLAADLGLPQLNPLEDRAMLCGSPEMLASIKSLLEKMKFEEGNTTRPGDFVVERAFVEK